MAKVDRAILDGEDEGFVRVHVRRGTDQIVGATVVATHASDMIGELSLAMTNKIGLGGIGASIHPYPTQSEAIRKVGDLYGRTRLTPFVKRLFGRWLAWQRS
jgi:pyruvate/2-oxoglutarate dehydrogenase complex dihydrolipoamide dehydrogenase (E3) component